MLSVSGIAPAQAEPVRKPLPAETPRIIGRLPDGTSPPPAPEVLRPELKVLDTHVHPKGDRSVIIQRVEAPDLPEPPPPPPAPDLDDSEIQARIAALRAKYVESVFVPLSCNVYDHTITHVRWSYPDGEGGRLRYECVSNIDFLELGGFAQFEAGGLRFALLMAVGNIDTREAARRGFPVKIPEHPPLPADGPGFVLIKGDPGNEEAMALIRGLHALYKTEGPRLRAAYEGRERARQEREAWLRANPPQPKDTVIRYSFEMRPLPQPREKGGAK